MADAAPRHARLTLENRASHPVAVYYQISYEIDVDVTGAGYLHSQFHRSNPLAVGTVHPILDRVRGRQVCGHLPRLGCQPPRLVGRGRGQVLLRRRREVSHDLRHRHRGLFRRRLELRRAGQGYTAYSTPFLGLHQIIRPDGLYRSQQRFGMYRWHLLDPIHFHAELRVDIQALGWKSRGATSPGMTTSPPPRCSTWTALYHAPAAADADDLEVG
ncbi:hypothetical protein I553_7484 [Mycobacterium xenopi 4042]|uniref:Uncharacterized protein n=1 Tax=Mycobacterium xenopi 4042 TaxID=1299334 RepID=X8E992_MYCXE|nr:hypothetical protein I553_7484 [Mycobacterium xenopi 4042]